MTPLLALALAAPALGAGAGLVAPASSHTATRLSALSAAACWLAIVADGTPLVRISRLHADPFIAAAGCGAALVAASLETERPAVLSGALFFVELAIVAGRVHNEGTVLAVGLVLAAGACSVAARPDDRRRLAAVPAAAGLVAVLIGVIALKQATGDWNIPLGVPADASYRGQGIALLAGAALLLVAGGVHVPVRRPGALFVAAGAFLGVRAAPLVRSHRDVPVVAVLLAAAAVVASVGRGRAPFDRPTLALGLLGLAAAAAPGQPGAAALLLLAAAVLAAAVGVRAAAALGLPGAVSLGLSLAAAGGWTALILGALAGAAVVGLAADAVRAGRPARPGWWVAPAVGVGAWLLVAPGSWGWVTVAGPTGLGSYDVGAARALAAGMLFVEGGLLLSRRRRRWYARASLGRAQSTDDHN